MLYPTPYCGSGCLECAKARHTDVSAPCISMTALWNTISPVHLSLGADPACYEVRDHRPRTQTIAQGELLRFSLKEKSSHGPTDVARCV